MKIQNVHWNVSIEENIGSENDFTLRDMKHRLRTSLRVEVLALVGMFCSVCGNLVLAQDVPKNWPWRGMLIQSCCGGAGPEDIGQLAKLGVNAVELNMNVRMAAARLRIPHTQAWDKTLEWVDAMLDACMQHDIVGIVRINQIPIDPSLGFNQLSSKFWDDPKQLKDAVTLAGEMAKHFAKRGNELVAYVVLSEPVVVRANKKFRPESLDVLQNQVIHEIRKYDKERYIAITPGPGGSPYSYTDYRGVNASRIIYVAHYYLPHAYTHQGVNGRKMGLSYPGYLSRKRWDKIRLISSLKSLREFQKKQNAHIWIGEFSVRNGVAGSNQYLSDLIDIFDSYGWGWTYFLYRGNRIWDPSCENAVTQGKRTIKLCPQNIGGTQRWQLLIEAFKESPDSNESRKNIPVHR